MVGWTPTDEHVDAICRKLSADVVVTSGEDLPKDAVDVLVAAFPTREQLLQVKNSIRALFVPFAGFPPPTRQLIKDMGLDRTLFVCNLHHNAPMTAELAVALGLAACKQVFEADRLLRSNDWSARGIPCDGVPEPLPMLLLQGKTALVVGYGEVGQRVARIMSAFGMQVLATRASASRVELDKHTTVHPPADLISLLPVANIVFLCVPLTSGTSRMLGRRELEMLPKGSVLVNVSRGEVVDEDALYEALCKRENLFAAGIDTWYNYPATSKDIHNTPVSTKNDFSKLSNVIMSPHRGGAVGLQETELARLSAIAEALNLAAEKNDVRAMPCQVDVERGY